MGVAAMISRLVTAFFGLYLLAVWLGLTMFTPVDPGPPGVRGGRIGPGAPADGLRLPG
jgi:hypothetical protein